MSNETEAPTRKPLKLSSPGKLELKKTVDGGQVRQSFPHGRTKTVTVELKKKRTYTQGAGGKMTEVPHEAEAKLGLTTPAPAAVEVDHVIPLSSVSGTAIVSPNAPSRRNVSIVSRS